MATTYRPAPAVARIAAELIAEHHPDLDGIRIDYVFRDPAAKSKGAPVWGSARKVSGLTAYLASNPQERPADTGDTEDFFVIEIAERTWAIISEAQKRGLVDHELSHCRVTWNDDGDMALSIAPHDLEEFTAVVTRHGLWTPNVADVATALVDAAGYSIPDELLKDA